MYSASVQRTDTTRCSRILRISVFVCGGELGVGRSRGRCAVEEVVVAVSVVEGVVAIEERGEEVDRGVTVSVEVEVGVDVEVVEEDEVEEEEEEDDDDKGGEDRVGNNGNCSVITTHA